MPAIPPSTNSKILVTGANGYVGMWIVRTLLEGGYSVLAVVRTEQKIAYMKQYFEHQRERFKIAVLDDMIKPGAFDEAVKGVNGVIHTASPRPSEDPDPDAMIVPSVGMTHSLLQSVLAYGTNVKRVIYTSSSAAIISGSVWREMNENDWNDEALVTVKTEGLNTPRLTKYSASKVLAERATWDIYKKHKSSISWDLVTLCPPTVFGPPIQDVNSISTLNGSLRLFYFTVLSPTSQSKEQVETSTSWVDVRDVGEAHLRALKQENAGGERIIISADVSIWQEWINLCSPGSGFPGAQRVIKRWLNNSKGKSILGMEYQTMSQTAGDTMAEFKAKGLI
ncbi:hypothetical protein BDQ17DRAFT_1308461 [Cyathus striatus]|nr:hypothetical protein BDQ17DRAFT_1308461 [Cyathus striatus]